MQAKGMWENRAVAIVTFGFDNDTGKTLVKLLRKMGIGKREIFDLRNDLRDPKQTESRVKFQVDGTHEWTQRAVYNQSKFPAMMRSCFSQVESLAGEDRPIIVFRACKTGYHRADTVGRTEWECLNRLEKIEPNGRRTRMFLPRAIRLLQETPEIPGFHTQGEGFILHTRIRNPEFQN